MESTPRYEILNAIATGEFATVCRARDRELGREVAVKQIHQQFLNDPRQLERYWREAQLLASLQHPNIITIYDVVRPKGWLILELMRGSLQKTVEAGPVDLDLLRGVLVCSLNALQFLHGNGVIHGDVKPSNMLVDASGRIKLGDFGLARRASNEQGSLLKGTTKYMAPELVNNQFGPVGPASDLYSLGFSAYELLCGPQFEALFPGLMTFGRDRQIAWLMWHAAPDRVLPPISRVLEGVPEDLARVIERLSTKDLSKRYQSAQEVLRDLRGGQAVVAGIEDVPEDAPPPVDKKKKTRRIAAIAAMAMSLALCAVMLLPSGRSGQQEEVKAIEGTVLSVDVDRRMVVVQSAEDKKPIPISVTAQDEFWINGKRKLLWDLQTSDRIVVDYQLNDARRRVTVFKASRPERQDGVIKAIEPEAGQITVAVGSAGEEEEVTIRVPADLKILLNGSDRLGDQPVTLADVQVGDRAAVEHVGETTGRAATELAVAREVSTTGTIRAVDPKKREITIDQGDGSASKLVVLPYAPKVEITLNDKAVLDQRALTPADLLPGDKATVTHDTKILRVDAYRILGQPGVVQTVQANSLEVMLDGQTQARNFSVDENTKISISGEPVQLNELRPGDAVDITHDSPSATALNARALAIAARRPINAARWALLIGVQDYDDPSLDGATHPIEDTKALQDVLVKRYAVPANQAVTVADPTLVRLKQGISSLLDRVQADHSVIVYFGGRALRDKDGRVYLAPKDFQRGQMETTGLSFQWLVDRIEACPGKEKLLLLDACPPPGADPTVEPSSAEIFGTLQAPPGQAALRTVTGIAGCSEGQRALVIQGKNAGLFASSLAQGLSGLADKNRDNRLEPTELSTFASETMASSGVGTQTPKIFLPDNRPPRFDDDARKAIREFAAYVGQSDLRMSEVKLKYTATQGLTPNEPEPKMIYALILLKFRQRQEAQQQFEALKLQYPELTMPMQGLAWLHLEKRDFAEGAKDLLELVNRVPPPKRPGDRYPPETIAMFRWAGKLREYAASADERQSAPAATFQKIDAAVADRGDAATQAFETGRKESRAVLDGFNKVMENANDDATKVKANIERRLMVNYASFPFDAAVQEILQAVDR